MFKVVIADDSPLLRDVLSEILQKNRISVIGSAKNGKEAVNLVRELKPDLLILDCEMPVMHGLEALSIIMRETPLPVFMFSSLTREGAAVTIKALELGAVDFLLKPDGGVLSLDSVANELVQKIRFIAIRSKFGTLSGNKRAASGKPDTGFGGLGRIEKREIDIIAMGSSTGGVNAAGCIIPKLPAATKPIVWVQHMPPNFTKSFAERLASLSKMKVREAQDGDAVETGVCYLAPGGFQMRVTKSAGKARLSVQPGEKVSGHCPSCNVLFDSVSEHYGANSAGVILTGMGDDGADGLVKMHAKGAFVIGQNEESCIVYGMPREAYLKGAVDVQLDVNHIAGAMAKLQGLPAEQAA